MSIEVKVSLDTLKLAREVIQDYIDEHGPHEKDSGAAYTLMKLDQAIEQAQKQQEPVAAIQLLNRLERNWHRMGELWERCQGKGWPTAESDEFTELRDDKAPANRKALLDLYTSPSYVPTERQRQPLTDEQKQLKFMKWGLIPANKSWEIQDWFYAGIAYAEAAHGIKGELK